MSFKELISKNKYFIIGIIISFLATALMILVMSFLIYFTDMNADVISTLSAVCLAVGSFTGAIFTAKKKKSQGLLNGLIISFISFIIILLVSLILGGKAFSVISLLHGVIVLLSGGIGGILGVNSKQKQLI